MEAGTDRLGLGNFAFFASQRPGFFHTEQNPVTSYSGPLRVGDRVVSGRSLWQAGNHGLLGDIEFADGFAVVHLGGGFCPIGPVAKIDLVQVKLENLFLAEYPLNLNGQHDFVEFAQEALVTAEEEVTRHLHGDGGAAGADFPVACQFHRGPHQAFQVDPVVPEKAFILCGQHRLDQGFRQFVKGYRLSALFSVFSNKFYIIAVNAQWNLVFHFADLAGWGELWSQIQITGGQNG